MALNIENIIYRFGVNNSDSCIIHQYPHRSLPPKLRLLQG